MKSQKQNKWKTCNFRGSRDRERESAVKCAHTYSRQERFAFVFLARGSRFRREGRTYQININVVTTLRMRPTMVMRLGASQRGVWATSQFHQGCSSGSRRLALKHEYLCSLSFRSCWALRMCLSRYASSGIFLRLRAIAMTMSKSLSAVARAFHFSLSSDLALFPRAHLYTCSSLRAYIRVCVCVPRGFPGKISTRGGLSWRNYRSGTLCVVEHFIGGRPY